MDKNVLLLDSITELLAIIIPFLLSFIQQYRKEKQQKSEKEKTKITK